MNKEALIAVDIQNDFCPGGALAVPEGDQVVEPINNMVWVLRQMNGIIVATRDWHPVKTSHFKNFGGIWPPHCIQDTEGGKFHQGLDLLKVAVFSKGMGEKEDAYSGFDARTDSGETLAKFLREQQVTRVYVGGLATDYCVRATALDAADMGFKTYLLTDAIRAVDLTPGDGQRAIEEMAKRGITLTTTAEVISSLAS